MLGVTYKTAWFMAHRIREAMKEDVKSSGPIGGEGKTVEADETYQGRREDGYVSPQRNGTPTSSVASPVRTPWWPLWNVAAVPAPSMSSMQRKPLCVTFWSATWIVPPIS